MEMGGRDFLSHAGHFRLEPEAPWLTQRGLARADFVGRSRGGTAAAAMLTPAFDLSQDPDFLTIAIRVPYARVSEFDVYFQGVDFKFYARPYFLRRVPPCGDPYPSVSHPLSPLSHL